MTSIGSSTTHTIKQKKVVPAAPKPIAGAPKGPKVAAKKGAATKRGGAPPLQPSALKTAASIEALKQLDDAGKKEKVIDLLRSALGDDTIVDKSKPRAASTTKDRSTAAADLAVAAKEIGVVFVLKQCDVMNTLQRMLFPEGLGSLFNQTNTQGMGLRASLSALSLSGMDMDDATATTMGSGGTDSKRGKSTPPNARQGSLLIIRALSQIVGKPVEPFVLTGFLAAALDECGSSSSVVREAAEDTATALIALASPWAFPRLISPMILQSLSSVEWRVKYSALEKLSQCAVTSPDQVNYLLPQLIPEITSQVFDTKAQVSKAAAAALMAICYTCKNPDVYPAIPAVVHAICKPADTFKAVDELMATTFIAPVDAATLSILCPVLARALKEKLAIRKRAACLVIKNMSRLVEKPEDVAPFGPLLVPELLKVSENVQFEEIRDAALEALSNLTKALGDAYDADSAKKKEEMEKENLKAEAEKKRIEDERAELDAKDEARRKVEEEERKKYKEAMDAARELDKIAEQAAAKKKLEDDKTKDAQARSTTGKDGKCQSCGLKKCLKTCMFYGK
jgi:hypothetical protein